MYDARASATFWARAAAAARTPGAARAWRVVLVSRVVLVCACGDDVRVVGALEQALEPQHQRQKSPAGQLERADLHVVSPQSFLTFQTQ